MKIDAGDTLVMIGDSITDCGREYLVGEKDGLGNGYVSRVCALLNAVYPKSKGKVVSTGINGHRVTDLAERWQTDVIDLNPDWVSVMIGINDVRRNFDADNHMDQADLSRYEEILGALVGMTRGLVTSALGHQSCLYSYKTAYYRCSTLFKHLGLCRSDGSYLKELTRMSKQELIILDDFGLEGFDGQARSSLLEILEDRHGRRSTIVVSQVPVNRWHQTISDETIADAICDRITHSAYRIELKGEAVRKIYGRRDIEREENAE